jgi:prepilin-type N-terminal cleavage/methylation domain-containing protein
MITSLKNKININGFTLVELLVVISIIGILSTFAMVSLNTARIKARDALRKGDMTQIRTALNLYYDDNDQYPSCTDNSWDDADLVFFGANADSGAKGATCYFGELKTALSSGSKPLVDKIPLDPRNPGNNPTVNPPFFYRYMNNTDGNEYVLVYYLEDDPSTPQIIHGR